MISSSWIFEGNGIWVVGCAERVDCYFVCGQGYVRRIPCQSFDAEQTMNRTGLSIGAIVLVVVLYEVAALFLTPSLKNILRQSSSYASIAMEDASVLLVEERKAMVIIEPREHPSLRYVLFNFHSMMPLEYDLYICHGPANGEFARKQASFLKNRTIYFNLVDGVSSGREYNALFKSEKFWEQIDAEIILVFQTDSVLCSKSPYSIQDFVQYGYIGCSYANYFADNLPHYWKLQNPEGKKVHFFGVGGLSLRRKSFQLDCISKYKTGIESKYPEDVFFSFCLAYGENDSLRPENATVLQRFCNQWDLQQPSFGVHKVAEWLNQIKGIEANIEDIPELVHYCPEILALKPDLLQAHDKILGP